MYDVAFMTDTDALAPQRLWCSGLDSSDKFHFPTASNQPKAILLNVFVNG